MKLRLALATLLGLLLLAGPVNARPVSIVGTYRVVTHATTGAVGTYYATFHIDSFNPSTGAITGHGNQGSVASFTISGTVKGSTIVMRVTDTSLGYTAYDRGTIAPDGNISGTLTDTNHNTGTWTMTRLATPVSSPPVLPQVVAVASGIDRDMSGNGGSDMDYGVILKNRSTSYDAVNLTATVRAVDVEGRSVATDEITISVIPAGSKFAIAGLMTPSVSLVPTRLKVSVKVGQRRPKGIRLPVATNVLLHQFLDVTGRFTNPYRRAMSQDAPIYAVFLDAQGRVVGGTSDYTGAAVSPRATVSFDLTGYGYNQNAQPVTAFVSVDPCSDFDVIDGTCVALARR